MKRLQITYAILTGKGGREANEDQAQVRVFPNGLVAAVADGLGGQGKGGVASKAAAEEITRCFLQEGSFAEYGDISKEGILKAVSRTNAAVISCQTASCQMMTTLAGLVLKEGQAAWFHVGDSRLYDFKNGKLHSCTLDHSVPQMAVLMGMISKSQIRFHPDRHKILRALGSESFEPDISGPVPVDDGFHAFLLCTDGFWEYVLEEEMEKGLENCADPKQWLLKMEQIIKEQALDRQDNYTAAAVFTGRKEACK